MVQEREAKLSVGGDTFEEICRAAWSCLHLDPDGDRPMAADRSPPLPGHGRKALLQTQAFPILWCSEGARSYCNPAPSSAAPAKSRSHHITGHVGLPGIIGLNEAFPIPADE